MSKTTIDQLSEAIENTRGRTPAEVVAAFCPTGVKIGGLPLIPLRAGHDLFLSSIGHPLSRPAGAAWTATDVAIALFAFTRPSRELFAMVEDGTLNTKLHEFLDEIPLGAVESAGADLIAHWLRSRATGLSMQAPSGMGGGSKKKVASAGGSHSSPAPAKASAGHRKKRSMKSRSRNSSR